MIFFLNMKNITYKTPPSRRPVGEKSEASSLSVPLLFSIIFGHTPAHLSCAEGQKNRRILCTIELQG